MGKGKLYRRYVLFEGQKVWVSGKTEKEAIEKQARLKQRLEEGQVVKESTMLVKHWVDTWFKEYRINGNEEYLRKDRQKAEKWICGTIGHLPLNKVKPGDVQAILKEMALQGKSDYMIKRIHNLLKSLFTCAVDNRLIQWNPVNTTITRPKGYAKQRRSITEYEREHLYKVVEKEPKLLPYLFMLLCGCRPAETFSLRMSDVIYSPNGDPMLHIRGTKTRKSDRMVPLPEYLVNHLPKKTSQFDYLFTTEEGQPYNEKARQRLWKRCKRELNISMGCKVYRNQIVPPYMVAPDLVPYCFRHTYATDLWREGVDIRETMYRMGHSDITTTANAYTHCEEHMGRGLIEEEFKRNQVENHPKMMIVK